MKYLFGLMVLGCIFSCQKDIKDHSSPTVDDLAAPPYDTVAVDSFSAGATSVDVVLKIKRASAHYQDSLRSVRQKMEEEKRLNKIKEEQKKLEAKKKEIESKRQDNTASENKKDKPVTP